MIQNEKDKSYNSMKEAFDMLTRKNETAIKIAFFSLGVSAGFIIVEIFKYKFL